MQRLEAIQPELGTCPACGNTLPFATPQVTCNCGLVIDVLDLDPIRLGWNGKVADEIRRSRELPTWQQPTVPSTEQIWTPLLDQIARDRRTD